MLEVENNQINFIADNNDKKNFCYYPQDARTQLDLAVISHLNERIESMRKGTYERALMIETLRTFWRTLPDYYKSQLADASALDISA